MTTQAKLRIQGMDVLIGAMGLIDAQRFVAAINREKCDYTKWRAGGLPALGIDGIAELANRLSDTLDEQCGVRGEGCGVRGEEASRIEGLAGGDGLGRRGLPGIGRISVQ